MANVRVKIVRYISDEYPGVVECHITNTFRDIHAFEEKVPIVTAEDLDPNSTYPRHGSIDCVVLGRDGQAVHIGVDPIGGYFECVVPATDVEE